MPWYKSFFEKHKLVGLSGMGLLFVYLILTIILQPFRVVFFRGLFLFISFITDWSMIFVLIPIYLNWFSSDYFQERKRTEFRNAITNGIMGGWVCIEWIRVSVVVQRTEPNSMLLLGKIILSLAILTYALIVIREAYMGRPIAHIIGRAREISCLAVMITPVIYNAVPLEFVTILAIILFFPMIYGVVEFVEFTVLPEPKFIEMKKRKRRI